MHDDELLQLLKRADEPAKLAPHALRDLPARVLRRRSRRRVARASAMLMVLLVGSISIVTLLERPEQQQRAGLIANVTTLPSEPRANVLATIDSQIDLHSRTAAMLTSIEQSRARSARASQRDAGREDVLLVNDRARDQAAMLLLQRADRLSNDASDSGAAAKQYRRAIELFPDTPAAAVAQRRLDQIKS
jgi:hypothetical protein